MTIASKKWKEIVFEKHQNFPNFKLPSLCIKKFKKITTITLLALGSNYIETTIIMQHLTNSPSPFFFDYISWKIINSKDFFHLHQSKETETETKNIYIYIFVKIKHVKNMQPTCLQAKKWKRKKADLNEVV